MLETLTVLSNASGEVTPQQQQLGTFQGIAIVVGLIVMAVGVFVTKRRMDAEKATASPQAVASTEGGFGELGRVDASIADRRGAELVGYASSGSQNATLGLLLLTPAEVTFVRPGAADWMAPLADASVENVSENLSNAQSFTVRTPDATMPFTAVAAERRGINDDGSVAYRRVSPAALVGYLTARGGAAST